MLEWIGDLIDKAGAAGIALLMFLENLFPPIPSEIVMPMAGFLAQEGKLSLPLAILAGLAGTLAGASFWYGVGRWTSEERLRRWADRHGRWVTLDAAEIDRLERWFERHRRWAVPVAHVVPGLRTMISIPAGLFAMPYPRFLLLSALGAGFWTGALAGAGYYLGREFEGVERWLSPVGTAIFAAAGLLYLYRLITFRRK